MFELNRKGEKVLKNTWWLHTFADFYNLDLQTMADTLCSGMSIAALVSAFFNIKPVHLIGHKADYNSIARYHLRLCDTKFHRSAMYLWRNILNAERVLGRKTRLRNTHIVTAVLCGHVERWIR